MIELIDFSKSYKNRTVVSNVNMKAEKGLVTGLLGLNGAGKTTILKAVCGHHYASGGKVLVSDEKNCFDSMKACEKAKSIIGYVPEISEIPEQFTVREFLYFIYSMFFSDKSFEEAVSRTAALCHISDVLDSKIISLSKGYKQRLNYAQALIHNPENIVLDEPVSGLDPAQIIQFRKMIKNLAAEKTILISTHLMQEVEALCDYIYILHNGKIACEGTIKQIISETECGTLEESFLKITGSEVQK